MTSGLVNASFSLPEWQAVKMIFFASSFNVKVQTREPDLWLACVNLSTQGSQDLAHRLTNGLKAGFSLLILVAGERYSKTGEYFERGFSSE